MQMRAMLSLERRYAEFFRTWIADYDGDFAIYRDLCAKADGPVLEVGCATGRVTRQLASLGHEVVAIDTRREMLEVARSELLDCPSVRLADFDLRGQPLSERFPVALGSHTSFNLLIDVEEQRLFLRHLRSCLLDEGTLVLDCFCPSSMACPEEVGVWREGRRSGPRGEVSWRERVEMLTPLLERHTQIFRHGDGPEAEVVTHRRYVPPTQVASLLDEAGFESVRWIPDFDLATESSIPEAARPEAPFMILATR